jgi:hypothetical protein
VLIAALGTTKADKPDPQARMALVPAVERLIKSILLINDLD